MFKIDRPNGTVGYSAYPENVISKRLIGRKYICNWPDGKGCEVTVQKMPAKEAHRKEKSGGFNREVWMIGSIVRNGEIISPREEAHRRMGRY
ncbi:MAG: hypothetical protein II399_03760 [Lachnospiraceae bacterium]|nr:hypothetical protein [Lachnospiraceae bacterium]